MSCDSFSIKDGGMLMGLGNMKSPMRRDKCTTAVGMAALMGQKRHSLPVPVPIPPSMPSCNRHAIEYPPQIQITVEEQSAPPSSVIFTDATKVEIPFERDTGTLVCVFGVSMTALIVFILNTSETRKQIMPVANALLVPMITMCIGISCSGGGRVGIFMGVLGTLSMSSFSMLPLVPARETNGNIGFQPEEEAPYYYEVTHHVLQFFGCFLASVYCTWRFLMTGSGDRTKQAVAACVFLLEFLFALLALCIQDPDVILWVWGITAWFSTLPFDL